MVDQPSPFQVHMPSYFTALYIPTYAGIYSHNMSNNAQQTPLYVVTLYVNHTLNIHTYIN